MKDFYREYIKVIKSELVPALGCTEPIAIAFAAAKVTEVLGKVPESLEVKCSGNIIKNVKGVVVPNSGNHRGIATAATLGAIAGNASDGLNVLQGVKSEDIDKCQNLIAKDYCKCTLAEGVENLFIDIIGRAGDESAQVIIKDTHTNIVKIIKSGKVVLDVTDESENEKHHLSPINIENIVDFAKNVPIGEIEDIFKLQVQYNSAISEEGLKNHYGANIGNTLLKTGGDTFNARVKGKVAAGSDARMGGCSMPVIINSGSGNQGLAVSLPVIEYAKDHNVSEEQLYRGLAVSNLISLYTKKKIGSLSAFCGASSAAAASGGGIAFLKGWSVEEIERVIEYTLVNVGGIICDGAKSSCAAKLATALDGMLLSVDMVNNQESFSKEEGLMGNDVKETIDNVCFVGKHGMTETDVTVLKIMTGEIDTSGDF